MLQNEFYAPFKWLPFPKISLTPIILFGELPTHVSLQRNKEMHMYAKVLMPYKYPGPRLIRPSNYQCSRETVIISNCD